MNYLLTKDNIIVLTKYFFDSKNGLMIAVERESVCALICWRWECPGVKGQILARYSQLVQKQN